MLVSQQSCFLRMEVSAFLYALVQAWPTPSPTAECLLVRREGERIRYLNEPRHKKQAPLEMTLPLRDDRIAAIALEGTSGVQDGRDYRGVPVLAALRQVPGTDWGLIAKVDADEIYRPMRQRSHAIVLVVGLLSAVCFAAFGMFWQRQRRRFYQREHEADLARLALSGRYAHLSRYVNDVVLLLAMKTEKFWKPMTGPSRTYGYSAEELLRNHHSGFVGRERTAGLSRTPGCRCWRAGRHCLKAGTGARMARCSTSR